MKQDRINALRAMYERGTKHESDQAKRLLERAGIPLKPDPGDTETRVEISFKTAFEKELIFQTYFSIFRDTDGLSYYKTRKKTVAIVVPQSHAKLLIEKAYKILDDYRKQLRFFEIAFIEKNNLHSDLPPSEPPEEKQLTADDVAQIVSMMSGISKTRLSNLLKGFGVK